MRKTIGWLRQVLFTKENLWAIILCLVILATIIMTTDSSPIWIYQGF